MKTVFKYVLGSEVTHLRMPATAEIVAVQMQRGTPCLWALLDTKQPGVVRSFASFGTGHLVPDDARYVGTVQMEQGSLVFHIFEVYA